MGVDGGFNKYPKRKPYSTTGRIFYPPSFTETDTPRDKSR